MKDYHGKQLFKNDKKNNQLLREPRFEYSSANSGRACRFSFGRSVRVAVGGAAFGVIDRGAAVAAAACRVLWRGKVAIPVANKSASGCPWREGCNG